jgi:hypothetical protein
MSRLSTRSNARELPAVDLKLGAKPVELLRGEASCDTWRIVEAFSSSALPFDLELAWSSGSGAGASAKVTVAHAARVSVFARSLQLSALNLVDKVNRVGVTVADGFAATRNRWEYRGRHLVSQVSLIPIPPFADTVQVSLADPTLWLLSTVYVHDGLGLLRAGYPVDFQLDGGIPVGGASALELVAPADVNYRAVFHLSL